MHIHKNVIFCIDSNISTKDVENKNEQFNNNKHDLDINSPKQKVYSKFKCTDTIFITCTQKFKCTKCNYEFSQKDELKMGMGSGKWDILKL